MYALLTQEQLDLRAVVTDLADSFSVRNPGDEARVDRDQAWKVLASSGLLGLREHAEGVPVASGVEVMVAAEALGSRLVPLPFVPIVLATELLARAGDDELLGAIASGDLHVAVGLSSDLADLGEEIYWGAPEATLGVTLEPANDSWIVTTRPLTMGTTNRSADLTQGLHVPETAGETTAHGAIGADDRHASMALALTAQTAETVGALRTALSGAVEYSKEREAYGVKIGTFQALQHIAADSLVAIEAAAGAASYASWTIDAEPADVALVAASTAKAYLATTARTVAENVMQMYGGIGQTWEHIAHYYNRRALVNTQILGNAARQLDRIADYRLGAI